ncbi:unnamed protein product [Fusarium graminearum]|uniref:Chromosome 4, complete genome n=1 Tax=Gibberella zeae (strain ATCC MYA-4620 / CBS 123657 / FGSC 9075 / NRRL 31084 / PH-1) TaxID=229533 RepID=A0A098DWE2_GIBZE|nr:unnamed protein product [Fusarium graminearum]CZS72400.1 unnamed protein product [Fusarium graminearum]
MAAPKVPLLSTESRAASLNRMSTYASPRGLGRLQRANQVPALTVIFRNGRMALLLRSKVMLAASSFMQTYFCGVQDE